jgi:hypothetical protein
LAKTIAKAEGKDLLLEFVRPAAAASKTASGVDPSVLLDSAVFLPRARAMFVLMRLTVSPDAAPEQIARIGSWIGRLAVTQFPTFVLLDANGAPYGRSEMAAKRVSGYRREFAKLRELRSEQDRELALATAKIRAAVTCQPNPIATGLCSFAFTRYAPARRRTTDRASKQAVASHAPRDPATTGQTAKQRARE